MSSKVCLNKKCDFFRDHEACENKSMISILYLLRNIWEKNWPEVQAAATGGLPQFVLSSNPSDLGYNVPVFSYHAVDAKDFESDIEFLIRNRYVTIDSNALLDHLEGRKIAPKRSVILSFDDGTRNLHNIVYPLLRQYGMKGVAFISPKYHQEEGQKASIAMGKNLMQPLSWLQIREMQSSGTIDFQSHTYEHRYIPRWPEPAELEGSDPEVIRILRGPALTIQEDFRLAKEKLEKELNKEIKHLAFPKFKATEEALRIGRALGYKAFWWGVLSRHSGNCPGQSPLYIARIDGRYLRRLPGEKREPFRKIIRKRYSKSIVRFLNYFRELIREKYLN